MKICFYHEILSKQCSRNAKGRIERLMNGTKNIPAFIHFESFQNILNRIAGPKLVEMAVSIYSRKKIAVKDSNRKLLFVIEYLYLFHSFLPPTSPPGKPPPRYVICPPDRTLPKHPHPPPQGTSITVLKYIFSLILHRS